MERQRNLDSQEIQKVSRSFILTLARPEEIYEFFINQPDSSDISFLRFLLAKKSSPEKGGERLTLFGGKISSQDDRIESCQREVIEELGLTFIPIGRQQKRFNKTLHNLGSFTYQYSGIEREVLLNAFYVDPENIGLLGDQKIEEVFVLTLSQLKALIDGGEFNGLQLEEHLRVDTKTKRGLLNKILKRDRFDIDKKNFESRQLAFSMALQWFEHIDNYLKRRFGQIFAENPEITLEEFKKRYEQEFIRFMKEGLRLSLPSKKIEESPASLLENDAKVIYEGLNGGFLGTDVLYFLPHIAHLVAQGEDPEKFLNSATETTLSFWRYFRSIYEEFLRNHDKGYENLTTLEEKVSFIEEFNEFAKKRVKQNFQLTDEEIKATFSHFSGFWSELEQDLKSADPELTKGLVQNYRLLNEVANAPFGRLILIFLGIDRYNLDNLTEEEKGSFEKLQKKLIFEAGRQLLLLMKGFLSVSHFEEGSKAENMIKVNMAIENFFGAPIMKIKIGEESIILAEVRKSRVGILIVDEKPGKRWISFLRKSFKERPQDIRDFSSYGIVYLGENKEKFIESLKDGSFKNKFLEFLKTQFPNSEVFLEEKSTFGFDNFVQNIMEVGGKRTGSQAKRIVGKKYILTVDKQTTEIVVYPFLSTKDAGVDNGFWMGWLEKRRDDADYVVRRMLAGENGVPSFYDLLFPPDIYPEQYKHRLQATYHL